jgi:hypothetical protein
MSANCHDARGAGRPEGRPYALLCAREPRHHTRSRRRCILIWCGHDEAGLRGRRVGAPFTAPALRERHDHGVAVPRFFFCARLFCGRHPLFPCLPLCPRPSPPGDSSPPLAHDNADRGWAGPVAPQGVSESRQRTRSGTGRAVYRYRRPARIRLEHLVEHLDLAR